ncbi:hypothetical protein L3X38_033082 [Prunus dulcis]|uniref:Protein kinase domain-containing protein n=1 Tax=Prunus dulcis TaxID=3755 RepID=A0AAD4YWM8_PRUDU|nr:hypothetical protein L3X38_033082 [Prunus dulcis]
MVRSVSEIMALLRPPKENTPSRRDPVEPLLPMIELSLYSIVSDYEDHEYFNCMMSDTAALGDYVLISEVGEGSFSRVWKAVHTESGEVVALKQVFLSRLNRRLKNCLDCEIKFLSSVCHPNIVRLLKAFQNEGCIFLVLEFCNGGNLAAYIRQHGRVQEQIARKFMQQLGAGLEILHSHHIIHRDLKPENILLSCSDDDAVVKVADFGLSRSLHPGDYAEKVCGSPLYMAPEVLQFERYDGKVDMWSVGVILFELLNGCPPFPGRTNVQVLKNIKSSTCLPFDQLILCRLHPDSVDMCSKLLSQNPDLALYLPQFHIFLLYPSSKLAIYVASVLGPGFSTRLGFYLAIPGY